jgi:phage-related protein
MEGSRYLLAASSLLSLSQGIKEHEIASSFLWTTPLVDRKSISSNKTWALLWSDSRFLKSTEIALVQSLR